MILQVVFMQLANQSKHLYPVNNRTGLPVNNSATSFAL